MDREATSSENTNHKRSTHRNASIRQGASAGISLWLIGGVCLLLAFLFLLISSKSSPLYPFNDWTDAHTFFTVGKGMFENKVPYQDLFEQKGPLVYLIFGLASLFSRTTFLGVFIFEVLSLAIFLFFSFLLMALYLDDTYALIGLPMVATAILNLRSFGHGGSAELFSLPLIAISLFFCLRYFKIKAPEPMSPRQLILNGVVAGCILWIKYSFVGFWLAWMCVILLSLLVNKHYAAALKGAAYFFGGMLITSLPWIIYFGLHGAIQDWLEAYFLINLTAYPMDLTLRERIMVPIDSIQRHLSLNPAAIGVLLLGMVVFLTHKKYLKDIFSRVGLLLSAVLLVLGVYGGGRDYIYYFFIFAPFITLGFIVLFGIYADDYGPIKSKLIVGLLVLITLAGTFLYTLRFQRNTYMLKWDRADQVQYRFAAIIQETPNPTLLNYGFQDSGFYTAADITPDTRFFQSYNIDYSSFPQPADEQNRYIKDGLVSFVVLRAQPSENTENLPVPYLYENYRLISTQPQLFGDTEFIYLLFEKLK